MAGKRFQGVYKFFCLYYNINVYIYFSVISEQLNDLKNNN